MPVCARCQSDSIAWVEASDDPEIYSYTIIHQANHEALADVTPYNAAIVIFPATQSVRLVSNIIDCAPDDLAIGMQLSLVWEEVRPDFIVPRFRPSRDART